MATLFHHISRLEEKVQFLISDGEDKQLQIEFLEQEIAEHELPSGPYNLDLNPAGPENCH